MRCPLCGGGPIRPLYDRLEDGIGLDRCLSCGLRTVRPYPSAAQVAALYTADYFRSPQPQRLGYEDYGALRPALEATFRRNLLVLRRHAPPGRLLDVGCAEGTFLALAAREAGYEVSGVEISAEAAARARAASGAPVHAGTLADLPRPERPYDVVTLWDVLEHTTDPAEVLARVAGVLRPGGILALTVPDPDGLAGRAMGRWWFGYAKVREHPVFFRRATLRAALVRAGFEVRTQRGHPYTVPAAWLLGRAARYAGAAARAAAAAASAVGLGGTLVPFPFVNQLVIAGRRAR